MLNMTMPRFVITILLLHGMALARGQVRWAFELHGGNAYNVPAPLVIKQHGYSNIRMVARYRTEGFVLPVYWDWRLSRWEDGRSWELEAIHHKLYLTNTTPEVLRFSISHGFNILTINRGYARKKIRYRAGMGIVLIHPESNVRGREFGDSANDWDLGYYIAGPVVSLAIGRPLSLGGGVFLNLEAKSTLAYSYTPISGGHAHVFNVAFHLVAGVGLDCAKKEGHP